MQEKQVQTHVVGIGKKVYPEELEKIAGKNVYLVDNFDQLLDDIKQIEESICSKFIYTTWRLNSREPRFWASQLSYYFTIIKIR